MGLWGYASPHFWEMHPQEVWRIYDTRRPHDPSIDYAGGLTHERCEELYKKLLAAREKTECPTPDH